MLLLLALQAGQFRRAAPAPPQPARPAKVPRLPLAHPSLRSTDATNERRLGRRPNPPPFPPPAPPPSPTWPSNSALCPSWKEGLTELCGNRVSCTNHTALPEWCYKRDGDFKACEQAFVLDEKGGNFIKNPVGEYSRCEYNHHTKTCTATTRKRELCPFSPPPPAPRPLPGVAHCLRPRASGDAGRPCRRSVPGAADRRPASGVDVFVPPLRRHRRRPRAAVAALAQQLARLPPPLRHPRLAALPLPPARRPRHLSEA